MILVAERPENTDTLRRPQRQVVPGPCLDLAPRRREASQFRASDRPGVRAYLPVARCFDAEQVRARLINNLIGSKALAIAVALAEQPPHVLRRDPEVSCRAQHIDVFLEFLGRRFLRPPLCCSRR